MWPWGRPSTRPPLVLGAAVLLVAIGLTAIISFVAWIGQTPAPSDTTEPGADASDGSVRPDRRLDASRARGAAREGSATVTAAERYAGLALGAQFSCVLDSRGTVRCWGSNAAGQLGVGDFVDRTEPTTVSALPFTTRVHAGLEHACAVLLDESLRCWGVNTFGQLGLGDTTNRAAPVGAPTLVSGTRLVALGDSHSCATQAGTGMHCWGRNSHGQLGLNDTTDRWRPALVPAWTSTVSHLALGGSHACLVRSDQRLFCWGLNDEGQLALGDTTTRRVPVLVASLEGVAVVAAGSVHSCALTIAGEVRCWGDNRLRLLGFGGDPIQRVPTAVPLVRAAAGLLVSGASTCAVLSSAAPSDPTQVWCWGEGGSGQLGTERLGIYTTPQLASAVPSFVALALGAGHACAIRPDSAVVCWGGNDAGQLGRRFASGAVVAPMSFSWLDAPGGVVMGGFHACAWTYNESVSCWGLNDKGQLGVGDTFSRTDPEPLALNTPVAHLALGIDHSCAIDEEDGLWCWGRGAFGRLGLGSDLSTRLSPAFVQSFARAAGVAVGSSHSCAWTEEGTVACWGQNSHGQVGVGTTSHALVPVFLAPFDSPVREVALGGSFSCAVTRTGSVRCWGQNSLGQLGLGDTLSRSVPTVVVGVSNATFLAVGTTHACAVEVASFELKCWGGNAYGQVGVGDTTFRVAPARVIAAVVGLRAVRLGEHHSCLLSLEGAALQCWGRNDWGQLGVGDRASRTVPTTVTSPLFAPSIAHLSVGGSQTCIVASTDRVHCWGRNTVGELGLHEATARETLCPAGWFFGTDACERCPAGTNSSLLGAVAETQCDVCPVGSWSAPSALACELCPAGTFSPAQGASTAGTCTQCPLGSWSGEASFACTQCPPGTASSLAFAPSSDACVGCPAGRFAGEGAAACESCPAGTWSDEWNATSVEVCRGCPASTWSSAGATECTSCVPGTASSTVNATTEGTCEPCLPGWWALLGATHCTACAPGRANNASGASGPQWCEVCPPGQWAGAAAPTCTRCPRGAWSSEWNATSPATCRGCAAGRWSPDDGAESSDTCRACPSGRWSSAIGAEDASACVECAAGLWSSDEGAGSIDTCQGCAAGRWSVVGATLCEVCPAGTASVAANATSPFACLTCPSGTWSSSAATECVACEAGTASAIPGATNSTACLACEPGQWAPVAADSCFACPQGTWSSVAQADSPSTCVPCDAGLWSSALAAVDPTTCIACVAGTWSAALGAADPSTCLPCAAGFASSTSAGTSPSTCVPCPAGAWSASGAATCEVCPDGTFSVLEAAATADTCSTCPNGTWSFEGAAECTLCPAGFASDASGASDPLACAPCPGGTWSAAAAAACELCPPGTWSPAENATDEATCERCPIGAYSAAGSARVEDCTVCPPGSFRSPETNECESDGAADFLAFVVAGGGVAWAASTGMTLWSGGRALWRPTIHPAPLAFLFTSALLLVERALQLAYFATTSFVSAPLRLALLLVLVLRPCIHFLFAAAHFVRRCIHGHLVARASPSTHVSFAERFFLFAHHESRAKRVVEALWVALVAGALLPGGLLLQAVLWSHGAFVVPALARRWVQLTGFGPDPSAQDGTAAGSAAALERVLVANALLGTLPNLIVQALHERLTGLASPGFIASTFCASCVLFDCALRIGFLHARWSKVQVDSPAVVDDSAPDHEPATSPSPTPLVPVSPDLTSEASEQPESPVATDRSNEAGAGGEDDYIEELV